MVARGGEERMGYYICVWLCVGILCVCADNFVALALATVARLARAEPKST
jgi:hypothetical protein